MKRSWKKIIDYVNRLIQSQTKESSNRVTLLAVASVVCLNLLLLAFATFFAVLLEIKVDWIGLATYITALTALLSAVLIGKVQQKKIENKNLQQ